MKRELSMETLKRMARKVFSESSFRPTESWCLEFIKKHGLERRVSLSEDC